ncbi:cytochrome P450 [Lineolata rhizophorae]|uniref:Cytochrome P450 n=1 Tax=Lineolata rhizophorae TaxID=578093 RepID=A0A6A6P241_9PEZI|nr:cytochrome P450 [Lineolata rhizophorae]
MLLELLLRPYVVFFAFPAFLCYLHHRTRPHEDLPPDIPWVGRKKQWFATARAHIREWTQALEMLAEGYEKHTKHDLAFATPTGGFRPEIILPPSTGLPFLNAQDDSVLSADVAQSKMLELRYLTPSLLHTGLVPLYQIRISLTRALTNLAPPMHAVLSAELHRQWSGSESEGGPAPSSSSDSRAINGQEQEWKPVIVYKTLERVFATSAAHVFYGPRLGSSTEFVEAVRRAAHVLVFNGAFIRFVVPRMVKPIIGPLAALLYRRAQKKIERFLVPEIEARLEKLKLGNQDKVSVDQEHKGDDDLLQWMIESAFQSGNPTDLDPSIISARLGLISFAALHTTSMTATHALFDLAASPASKSFLAELRAEADAVLGTPECSVSAAGTFNHGSGAESVQEARASSTERLFTRAGLARLAKLDSALRESMRVSGLGGRGMMREVMAPKGLVLPDGRWVPRGVWVGMPIQPVHEDEELYANAKRFEAFRFVREPRTTGADVGSSACGALDERSGDAERYQMAGDDDQSMPYLRRKNLSMVTTTPSFLAFAHGKHACPGRFFAAQQLKLVLAEIVRKYDIHPLDERPPNQTLGDFSAPSMEATIFIRPRQL